MFYPQETENTSDRTIAEDYFQASEQGPSSAIQQETTLPAGKPQPSRRRARLSQPARQGPPALDASEEGPLIPLRVKVGFFVGTGLAVLAQAVSFDNLERFLVKLLATPIYGVCVAVIFLLVPEMAKMVQGEPEEPSESTTNAPEVEAGASPQDSQQMNAESEEPTLFNSQPDKGGNP